MLWTESATKSRGIRHRLLSILLLGIVVSGLSTVALINLLTTTARQRVERARETTTSEVERIAQLYSKMQEHEIDARDMPSGRNEGKPGGGST